MDVVAEAGLILQLDHMFVRCVLAVESMVVHQFIHITRITIPFTIPFTTHLFIGVATNDFSNPRYFFEFK